METCYTVEQVAKLLTMHPKTIQRYIREGKLGAKKIGKSWRIFKPELKRFMKAAGKSVREEEQEKTMQAEQVQALVSSVADIRVQGYDEAARIEKMLVASLNGRSGEFGKSTLHTQYIEQEQLLRISLWGSLLFMQKIFSLLVVVTDQGKEENYINENRIDSAK